MIPAGGAGSRLWPRSRQLTPKHLLDLVGDGRSLLQQTHDRVAPLVERVFVLTEERQVPLIRSQLPDAEFIIEPTARGTTSALGLAAFEIAARDPEAVMISVPADHVIEDQDRYRESLEQAIRVAQTSGKLVTIGLRPTRPATGFGYIEAGEPRGEALQVVKFVEKPPLAQAEEYVASGRYFWNLAMFSWRVATFLEELARVAPAHHRGLVAFRRGAGEYAALPVDAIDFAVLEKTANLLLVPASFGWRDIGSWAELSDMRSGDADGNFTDGEAALLDTRNSFFSAPGKLVAAIGVEDLVVIDTEEALLILPRNRAEDVKKIVEQLRATGRTRYL